jgi:hypothetical protein
MDTRKMCDLLHRLTVLELCMVEGIPQPRNLPLVTARGKHHNEEVEILTTYLGVPNSYVSLAKMVHSNPNLFLLMIR